MNILEIFYHVINEMGLYQVYNKHWNTETSSSSNLSVFMFGWGRGCVLFLSHSIFLSFKLIPGPYILAQDVFMMMSSNGNIFRVIGHLCREFNCPQWIPCTKASCWNHVGQVQHMCSIPENNCFYWIPWYALIFSIITLKFLKMQI